MTTLHTLHGRILTPLGWRRGQVQFDSHVRQLQVDDHSGGDDPQLWACNKWLLAHPDSAEAKAGAYVGLVGENVHI